jgi:hypothetical protein
MTVPLRNIPACGQAQTLSGALYTLNRLPRKKPTSVMSNRRATSTARLLGAEIAHTMGTPAVRHFCRISKLLRPLTMTA